MSTNEAFTVFQFRTTEYNGRPVLEVREEDAHAEMALVEIIIEGGHTVIYKDSAGRAHVAHRWRNGGVTWLPVEPSLGGHAGDSQ